MVSTIKLIIFFVGSAGIIYISLPSLRSYRFHGFYRFFAWEAILALILLNINYWFVDPFSVHQIFAWFFLIVSLFLVIHGVQLLRIVGKPDESREDEGLVGLEKTTRLVTVGAYKYIRHPLYSSLFFLAWGAFFKMPSWPGGALAVAATAFLVVTAKIEEKENIHFFGSEYEDYIKRTRMFVPYVF